MPRPVVPTFKESDMRFSEFARAYIQHLSGFLPVPAENRQTCLRKIAVDWVCAKGS
jgi:hypothetical protein